MNTKRLTRYFISRFYLAFGSVLLLLLCWTQGVAAAGPEKQACTLFEQSLWSTSETWVWEKIRLGVLADLREFEKGDHKRRGAELWSQQQKLSARFIETLLLEKTCQDQIPRRGVDISGAWFPEPIDLSHAVLAHPLSLVKTRFDEDVIMDGLKSIATLRFSGSTFNGMFRLSESVLGGNLFLNDNALFDELQLANAKIAGQLDMTHSHYTGPVDMDSLDIEDSLFMQFARFEEAVDITYASIGSVLVLPGDYDDVIDLSGTRIGIELRLSRKLGSAPGEKALIENEEAMLILRSTIVAALQDRHGTWPTEIELDGFTYERLGGYVDESGGNDIALRTAEWFIDEWLAKDESYTAQPYRQLAAVLRSAGLESKAGEILYASKERERHEADGLRWLGLSLLNYTMGYGYRYSYALVCVIALVMIGAIVLKWSGEGKKYKMPYGIAYSLDMLLPIVQLRKYHYDEVNLKPRVRHYFYFHILMGYTLASFLIAGLSGLTK